MLNTYIFYLLIERFRSGICDDDAMLAPDFAPIAAKSEDGFGTTPAREPKRAYLVLPIQSDALSFEWGEFWGKWKDDEKALLEA
jgi:hypothetical protein